MPYIDASYYLDDFKGEPAATPDELDKLIARASDLIDQVTGYHIKDFDKLPIFVQDLVKKATAYQVEFYILNGGAAAVDSGEASDLTSVTVGAFSYSGGGQSSSGSASNAGRVSPSALECLVPTGLLYRGISTSFRGWCC